MEIDRDEIALCAYLAWERDGRPSGRDLEYWLDAERQLRATRDLLLEETQAASRAPRAAGPERIAPSEISPPIALRALPKHQRTRKAAKQATA